ncbi:hypothetical protein [Geobacillus sp. WSUCF1]|uniref:hypothetical protein n=1 Tax=Geobacillus sp. WSUCF1 TaxID=886559 RepID=UPI000358A20C|nr:hypothetical protein [Geobacillus sp. WSUCF1]EPR29240.1 Diacylglycerol kinase family protein [Geobacillus sp. WSUCF1]
MRTPRNVVSLLLGWFSTRNPHFDATGVSGGGSSVFWGGHVRMKEVSVFAGRNVHIRPAAPVPVHADGEEAGVGEVSAWIEAKRMRVIGAELGG